MPARIGREDKIEDRSRRSRFGSVVHSDSTDHITISTAILHPHMQLVHLSSYVRAASRR